MNGEPLQCWHCEAPVDPDRIEFDAVLVPRTASRGGPVLILRCPDCGIDSVVERNPAREHLLVPPPLAGVRESNVRGRALYRAKKWGPENAARRAEFLNRKTPARATMPGPEEAAPPPDEEAQAAADEDAESPPPRRNRQKELNSVLQAYETFDLPLTASPTEIRKRFRELSRKCHPDRVADLDEEIRETAERRFREIRRAYELLTGE